MGTSDSAWWKSAVVYQIYPRSFADSNGDGVGDLRGIIDRLDYLATLGVDVVWLSPIYRSPQADFGYDISDYRDIDPSFGTLADFDALVEGLHERGMKLMMDLVVNHTSDEHAWFEESRSSKDNPKRDWYVWRDPVNGGPPNNWGAFFGGSVWDLDPSTGQYYLHLFHTKQPDLNWENPEVRAAVYEMMRWWLDRGVDGFRMDVINFISKVEGLPDAPNPTGAPFVNAYALFADGPRVHEYLAEMTREVFADRPGQFITVGEAPGVTPEQARLYTDESRRELDMVFQFEHVGVDHAPAGKFHYTGLDLVVLKKVLHKWQRELADVGWNSLYWNNHDQPRVVSRFGDDDPEYWQRSATALGTILHGMRGTPYVYQGEELGMTNYPFTPEQYRDPESINYLADVRARGLDEQEAVAGVAAISRDNARTPVQWDSGANAGFSTGESWLPVNDNHSWLNAAAQVDAKDSVFAHYRRLIGLRHECPIFVDGDFQPIFADDPQLWGFLRSTDSETMLVIANCGRQPKTVSLDDAWPAESLLLANTSAPEQSDDQVLELGPWDARIYLRQR